MSNFITLTADQYCNNFPNVPKNAKVLPRVYCDCAGCRDDILEMAIGVTHRKAPKQNVENHHCCECKCKYCVCEKQRYKNKYMRFPIIPNTQNHCYCECEVCMNGISNRLENKSKVPVQNFSLYPYLLESYEKRFTDKITGKLNTKELCNHVHSLDKKYWFSFNNKEDQVSIYTNEDL